MSDILSNKVKLFLKAQLWRAGYELRKFHPSNSIDCQRQLLFQYLDIRNVIDVGANAGQYGETLRAIGFCGTIVSFEPGAEAYRKLRRCAAGDPLWRVAERSAIGSNEGVLPLRVADNSVSSSLLKVTNAHLTAAPDSVASREEHVSVRRLDDVLPSHIDMTLPTYLKIDTQGYEWEVLLGAEQVLAGVSALEIELSLVPLYDGQVLMDVIVSKLGRLGFSLWGIWPEFANGDSGQVLQVNGVFVRDL